MRKLLLAALTVRVALTVVLTVVLTVALAPLYAETIVIRNAVIMTVTKGTVHGSIVVKDGKIADVGEKVMEPTGATIIDAGGQYVIPGIIDCHSHIAGDGGINEGSVSVSSMANIKDIINPEDIAIYRALAGGVTTANILHGSANSIGGQTIVLKMRWGKDAQSMIFEGAKPGIKFALGENVKRSGNPQGGRGATGAAVQARYPATRMGVEDVIREAFTEAKAYKAEWDGYKAQVARGEHPIPPRTDLKLEPLKEVLEGNRYVHSHSYRADEILMLMRVADDYGFKIRTFQHVLEGYKVAKEMAAHGAGGSTFSDWWDYKVEAVDAIPYNAAIMQKAGVVVSLNSDDAELMRHLNTEAAKTMKYGGMTETEALSMVTINPAKQLGIDNRVGSIEVGKDADLVLYDKYPLSDYAKVEKVLIDGAVYFDRDKEVSERAAEAAAKQKLVDKLKQQQQQNGGRGGRGGEDRMKLIGILLTGALAALAGANDTFLIRDADVYPVTAKEMKGVCVLIRDGKIAEIAPKIVPPKGMKVVEGKGLRVYPGMIDSDTNLGLQEIQSVRESVDTGELGEFMPQLRALVAVNPASEHFGVVRVNGITSAMTFPGGGGGGGGRGGGRGQSIEGQAALIHTDGFTWEEMEINRSAAMQLSFPSVGGGGRRGGGGGLPDEIAAEFGAAAGGANARRNVDDAIARINDFFDEARRYKAAKAANPPGFVTDLKMEAMIPVIDGKVPVAVAASQSDAIHDAIAFADKQHVRIVIMGPREIGKVGPELKSHNIPVILGRVLALPEHQDDAYEAAMMLPAEFYKAGVKFAFGTFTNEFVRNLPFQAAAAVAFGLPQDEALKAVTINPAEIWGVSDKVGSVEKGKWADLLITNGDPLEIQTKIEHIYIKGMEVDLSNKQTRLYDKYISRQ